MDDKQHSRALLSSTAHKSAPAKRNTSTMNGFESGGVQFETSVSVSHDLHSTTETHVTVFFPLMPLLQLSLYMKLRSLPLSLARMHMGPHL